MILRTKYVKFVFRHRWEKNPLFEFTRHNKWEMGLWMYMHKAVGKKDFKTPHKWKNNMVPCYLIGIDMLIFSAWIDISLGNVMTLGVD